MPSVVSLSDNSPAIEVRDLVKTFGGVTAVQGLSFAVARGEIVGFLGPNGAGKSTTMRILTGFLGANSGTAAVCGVPVASRGGEVKRLIGYMPENNPLYPEMRVRVQGAEGVEARQVQPHPAQTAHQDAKGEAGASASADS